MTNTTFQDLRYPMRNIGCRTMGCGNNIKQWNSRWGWLHRCAECAERWWRTGTYSPESAEPPLRHLAVSRGFDHPIDDPLDP
jgi:hypothetical protein